MYTKPGLGHGAGHGPPYGPPKILQFLQKKAQSGKFSQNLVKRGMEPAEDCRHHEKGYCATVKCDAFRQWLQWAKNKITSSRPWGTTIRGIKKKM